jgi:hypothetical protein
MSYILVAPATSLATPVSVANGGTGAATAAGAKTNLSAAGSGANADITSMTGASEISNASLKLGAVMGMMGFYGVDAAPQQAATNAPLMIQGGSYNAATLNASLNSLEAGINEILTALQTIGLIA